MFYLFSSLSCIWIGVYYYWPPVNVIVCPVFINVWKLKMFSSITRGVSIPCGYHQLNFSNPTYDWKIERKIEFHLFWWKVYDIFWENARVRRSRVAGDGMRSKRVRRHVVDNSASVTNHVGEGPDLSLRSRKILPLSLSRINCNSSLCEWKAGSALLTLITLLSTWAYYQLWQRMLTKIVDIAISKHLPKCGEFWQKFYK